MVSMAEKALRRHPRSDHAARSVDLLSLHLRFRNRARVIFAAADHCRGVAKGEGAARAATFDFCHCIASRGHCKPDVGRHRRNGGALSREGRFGLTDILLVCVPSTLIGVLAGAFAVRKMGVELEEDPVYQQRLARGELREPRRLQRRAPFLPERNGRCCCSWAPWS